jgi:hypothetical protein
MRYRYTVINKGNRWAHVLVAVALAYLITVYVVPGILAGRDSEAASGSCVPRHAVGLDRGEHDGHPWRIMAGVEKNPGCSFWLLNVEFFPQGKVRGSWSSGWGIPAGGHLPAAATIAASDYPEGDGRAVGGVVGSRVRRVVFRLSGGGVIVVHPKDPRAELRSRFVWLHGLRYFLRFYPAGAHVKTAELLDAKGKTITKVHSEEGEIEGFMVV